MSLLGTTLTRRLFFHFNNVIGIRFVVPNWIGLGSQSCLWTKTKMCVREGRNNSLSLKQKKRKRHFHYRDSYFRIIDPKRIIFCFLTCWPTVCFLGWVWAMWYRGGNPILHQDAWAWAPSRPGAALWAWLRHLASLTFSFLCWKMKRLVLINIPHFLPHSYSISSGLIFLGMLTCIVSDESVEKKPSLCQT